MPKNKGGGRNHKKQGNKHTQPTSGGNIRLPKDRAEMVAKVVKPLGNGRAEVQCSDGVVRILEIRKKFRGRNKRDNNVCSGCMVLVGLREWEVRNEKKKPKVDLLYVYSSGHHDTLLKDEGARYLLTGSRSIQDEMSGFEITNVATWKQKIGEPNNEVKEDLQKVSAKVEESIGMNPLEDNDFNWDDI